MRVAVYYAPSPSDPLWDATCHWLGRDPETAAPLPQPDLPDIAAITAEPRRYGVHATLKPPMQLRGDWFAFVDAAAALADRIAPFDLPPLAVADLHGFLALREVAPCRPLHALADACVTELDGFREPPGAAEIAKRRGAGLSPAADAMLLRWGYPYVLDTWRFHMTLTRRLTPPEREIYLPAATAHFAATARLPREVRDLCLFTEAASGAAFTLAERLPLRG
jgi:putative phosphonate metabolism protein